MTGVLVLVVTLAVASVAGLTMRARSGRMRPAPVASASTSRSAAVPAPQPVSESASKSPVPGIDLALVGAEPGERATLLQFSSAFCAPCRATRTMLSDVAGVVPGVRHVEVDVADSDAVLELVRALDVRRTPTTLVLDAGGREVRRASGVPRREQVLVALAEAAGSDGHVR